MQPASFENYKFISHCHDHLTTFSTLRPLKSKRTAEVTVQFKNIFLIFGPPHTLQNDDGRGMTASVISDIKDTWPACIIIHGKPRHPYSQGRAERLNADVKDMLVAWMRDNVERSPYKASFGCDASLGLVTSSLPQEILVTLETGEALLEFIREERVAKKNELS